MGKIKVRAWHKIQQKMYSAEELGEDQMTIMPDGRGMANISGRDTRLSQVDNGRIMIPLLYINHKDKDNKEIYEGDIVNLWGGTFAQGFWEYNSIIRIEITGACLTALEEAENIVIMGNIYENPELMEVIRRCL